MDSLAVWPMHGPRDLPVSRSLLAFGAGGAGVGPPQQLIFRARCWAVGSGLLAVTRGPVSRPSHLFPQAVKLCTSGRKHRNIGSVSHPVVTHSECQPLPSRRECG
jgi:hypothetical protein